MYLTYMKYVSFLYCSIFGNEKRHCRNKGPWKLMKEWAFYVRPVVPGTVIEYSDFYS